MTKYLLTDWEINGYDDSDFMCSYFDDVTNIIGFQCYGSTRYAGATNIGISANGITSVVVNEENVIVPTASAVEKARLVLEEYIFQRMTAGDKLRTEEPNVSDLRKGMRVRLLSDARMQARESILCAKCNGGGKWINPGNPNDQRNCFGCGGAGQIKGDKVKANGKQAYIKLAAGLSGEIVDWTSFGKFYRDGYNQPNRENTTVQFRTDNGVVRACLNKLRMDKELANPNELRERAKSNSFDYQFSVMSPGKHAWDSRNFASEVAGDERVLNDTLSHLT